MQTKTKLLFKSIILVVFLIGTIGCKSNGGRWYDLSSYSLYNPLKPENHRRTDTSPTAVADNLAKPHIDPSRVDVKQPEGGYYDSRQPVLTTRTTSDIPSGDAITTYPTFTPTGFHSEQPSQTAPNVPTPGTYNAYPSNPGSSSPPINPAGYTYPTGYSQPTNYGQPTSYTLPSGEVKNDTASLSNPYATPTGTAGYPTTTTYSSNPQPSNPQDTSRSVNPTVASPFANPTGQPPVASYGGSPTTGTDPSVASQSPIPAYSGSHAATPNPAAQNPPNNGVYGTNGITTSAGSVYANPSYYQ